MSESEKQISKNINKLIKKCETHDYIKKININNYSILSLLIENNKRTSLKTTNSNSFIRTKDKEINKFDELNNSLSDISNFDLEKEGEKEENNSLSFNSSKEDLNDKGIITITTKSKLNNNDKDKNNEYEFELDKEFQEILKDLLKN